DCGTLMRRVGETPHQSCLVVTSREVPPELGPLRGELGPVRTLGLVGLDIEDGQALLRDKRLDGDASDWQALVTGCGGNGLALKMVGETIRELFSGSISAYLEYASATPGMLVGGARHPLLKATAKDYVRRNQERLIVAPLLERLVATSGSARAAEGRLRSLLDRLRARPLDEQGYGPGNLVNLLRLLRGDLRRVDLSGLAIRQAYLQDVEAQGASLAGSQLSETVLGEAFNYPTSRPTLSADGAYLAVGTANGEI